jgi:hypothetical protein
MTSAANRHCAGRVGYGPQERRRKRRWSRRRYALLARTRWMRFPRGSPCRAADGTNATPTCSGACDFRSGSCPRQLAGAGLAPPPSRGTRRSKPLRRKHLRDLPLSGRASAHHATGGAQERPSRPSALSSIAEGARRPRVPHPLRSFADEHHFGVTGPVPENAFGGPFCEEFSHLAGAHRAATPSCATPSPASGP